MPVKEKVEVRLPLDADLLRQARTLDLDLSRLLEASIRRAMQSAPSPGRTTAPDDEVAAFDRHVAENGPFYRSSNSR
jgi:post-segregation antitoxin (ccd killing protein)